MGLIWCKASRQRIWWSFSLRMTLHSSCSLIRQTLRIAARTCCLSRRLMRFQVNCSWSRRRATTAWLSRLPRFSGSLTSASLHSGSWTPTGPKPRSKSTRHRRRLSRSTTWFSLLTNAWMANLSRLLNPYQTRFRQRLCSLKHSIHWRSLASLTLSRMSPSLYSSMVLDASTVFKFGQSSNRLSKFWWASRREYGSRMWTWITTTYKR